MRTLTPPTMCVWLLGLGALVMPLLILPMGFEGGGKVLVFAVVTLGLGICVIWGAANVHLVRAPFAWAWLIFVAMQAVQVGRSLNVDAGVTVVSLQAMGVVVGIVTALFVTHTLGLLRLVVLGSCCVSLIGVLEYWGIGFAQLPSAGRPSATLGFRNFAAMYLIAGLFFSFALFLKSDGKDRWFAFAAVIFTAVFLIYTRSRGAWIGVVLAGVLGGVVIWRCGLLKEIQWRLGTHRWFGVAGLVVIVMMSLVPPKYEDRTPSRLDEKKETVVTAVSSLVQEGGDRGRFKMWQHTFAMMLDHPILGVGLGNWAAYYPKYDRGDVMGIGVAPRRPHNDFLWIGAELGLVGLLLYGWVLFLIAKHFWTRLQKEKVLALPVLCLGLGAFALLVHSCFSFPREQAVAVFFMSLMLGAAGQKVTDDGRVGIWQSRALGIVFLLVGAGGLWWGILALQFDMHFAQSLQAQGTERADVQVAQAQKAQQKGLFDHRILLLEGDGHYRLGNYAAAIEVYRKYLSVQPHLPAVYNNLGRALEGMGDDGAAEETYLEGVRHFSGVGAGFIWSNLAALYKRQGRVEEAVSVSEQTTLLSADGYHNLGLMYAELGRFDDALGVYEKALALNPDMAIAHFSMAGVKMLLGRLDDAAIDYELFLGRWTGKVDYVRDAEHRLRQIYPVLGDQYLRAQNFGDAARVYARLFDLGEGTPEVLNNLVLLYGRLGQVEKAIAFGQSALNRYPQFVKMHLSLATVYDGAGKRDLALTHYEKFLHLWSTSDGLSQRAKARVKQLRKP